ncbi:MAG: methylated-DNA--protein-cysteine methyltransferase [Evtepia sp.]|jgi:methylated-DNA-[protein]-cysteine S-methyltransferase|nr:methylated-DNA--protein-cysteine methyltransferase [Evtepia sp.]
MVPPYVFSRRCQIGRREKTHFFFRMRGVFLSTYESRPIFYGAVFSSPLGPITVRTNQSSIISLTFGDLGDRDQTELLSEARLQLDAYFCGKLKFFQLPLFYRGTEFQHRVWTTLQKLPYGITISYRELAERVDSPRGFRAVGNANGKNPLPILIPCHRVIAHNGSLGGYSSGLERKRFLLALEQHEW